MNIDSLVNLTITIQDKATTGPDLGTPLLLGYHTAWVSDLVREYSTVASMLDDGFSPNDYLYQQAQVLKSQDNAPARFKVGRRTTPLTQTVRLIPTVTTQGFVYSGTIDGQSFSFTVPAAATVASVVTALTALINPFTRVNAADDVTHVTVTATAGLWVAFDIGAGINLLDVTPDATTDDELAAIEAEDAEWYGLLAESSSPASIQLYASYIEARRKLCIVQSPDWNVLDAGQTTDIASVLRDANYTRTYGIYHRKFGGTEWLATGWMGGRLTAQPGSETWAFKSVNGVSIDRLSSGQESALAAKNFNHYTRTAGVNMTFDGKSGAGRYGDVVRFIDWVFSEIQLGVVNLLVNNKKVPYTNPGAAAIQSVVAGVLQRGIAAGGLTDDPAPVVTVPRVQSVPAATRAQRILPDVNFAATLAGAVHGTVIRGVVSV